MSGFNRALGFVEFVLQHVRSGKVSQAAVEGVVRRPLVAHLSELLQECPVTTEQMKLTNALITAIDTSYPVPDVGDGAKTHIITPKQIAWSTRQVIRFSAKEQELLASMLPDVTKTKTPSVHEWVFPCRQVSSVSITAKLLAQVDLCTEDFSTMSRNKSQEKVGWCSARLLWKSVSLWDAARTARFFEAPLVEKDGFLQPEHAGEYRLVTTMNLMTFCLAMDRLEMCRTIPTGTTIGFQCHRGNHLVARKDESGWIFEIGQAQDQVDAILMQRVHKYAFDVTDDF